MTRTILSAAGSVIPMAEHVSKGRTHFAEYAEAVGVATDQIAAVSVNGETIWVIYSDRDDDNTDAMAARFIRNEDGLLVKRYEVPMFNFFDGAAEELLARLSEYE